MGLIFNGRIYLPWIIMTVKLLALFRQMLRLYVWFQV